MNTNTEHTESITEKKKKIRDRYKGVELDTLDVIPAKPQEDFFTATSEKRVAVYARVSTDDPRQTSSYELQKNHYTDMISRHEGWIFVDMYADEGISGTSLEHRDAFNRMMLDCRAGKIDLIVTKSVSRFARNIVDSITSIRELRALNPPVEVFFETENLHTLDPKSDMSLSFMSTLAQEESHNKSDIMNSSIEMRFKRGIFLTPPLLGYDNDDEGNLVINNKEAITVKLIFDLYLTGNSCQNIAKTLSELGCRTKKNNTNWSAASVLNILQNERYCGDVLARKTFTPNYLDHKSKKNRQDRNQYLMKEHHTAIISRGDFIAVQHMISNAKYGNKSILPQLQVVTEGIFQGFVSINPRWTGFKDEDYYNASRSVTPNIEQTSPETITAHAGDFDLRDFEITHGHFFEASDRNLMTISDQRILFNTEAIRKFNENTIEILLHPEKKLLAIRPCKAETKNAMKWSKLRGGTRIPRYIAGTAFLPTIYHLLSWNTDYKYRVIGVYRHKGNESFMIFNLNDTEVLIPQNMIKDNESSNNIGSKTIIGYPASWSKEFGNNFYENISDETMSKRQDWDTQSSSQPYKKSEINVREIETIKREIDELKVHLKENNDNE